MKIEYYDGCQSQQLKIDGKDFADMKPDEQKEFVKKLIASPAFDESFLFSMVADFISCQGNMIDEYCCEECGDINITYQMEL